MRIRDWLERLENANEHSQKRTLDDADVADWFTAADERKPLPQNREEIIKLIEAKNPHRWWRLNYDYRWLRRQMKKLGYNPDDARELL